MSRLNAFLRESIPRSTGFECLQLYDDFLKFLDSNPDQKRLFMISFKRNIEKKYQDNPGMVYHFNQFFYSLPENEYL